MTLKRMLLLPIVALTGLLAYGQEYTVSTIAPKHLQDAEHIAIDLRDQAKQGLVNINGIPLNQYGASWSAGWLVQADPANGILATQNGMCSNFVSRILLAAYNWDWKQYSYMGSNPVSPSAKQYNDYIENGIGFDRIGSLDLALPGDILAVEYKDNGSSSTGHVMIVKSIGTSRIVGMNRFVEVTVVDTSSGKHSRDSRELPNGTVTQGTGIGVIGVLVNGAGEVLGYTWSLPTGSTEAKWLASLQSRLYTNDVREMVIGRLKTTILPYN